MPLDLAKTLDTLTKLADTVESFNNRIARVERGRSVVADAVAAHEAIRRSDAERRAAEAERERVRARAERRARDVADYKFDSVRIEATDSLSPWGKSMSPPMSDETLPQYKRRAVATVARQLPPGHKYYSYDFQDPKAVPLDVLPILSQEVMRDAKAAVWDESTVGKNRLREVTLFDDATGTVRERRFVGTRHFIHDFNRPGKRVNFIARGSDGHFYPLMP
jgi:hypothetical protein